MDFFANLSKRNFVSTVYISYIDETGWKPPTKAR
jgi:hypothetical protein